jgi:quercetin dioxygenase-like cupin family protein
VPENAGDQVRSAQVVLPCRDVEATLGFFVERLGFRLESIQPADGPVVAVISGHGVRLRLQRGAEEAPGHLRLLCHDPRTVAAGATEITAPNGTRIELVEADPPLVVPPARPVFSLTRLADAAWSSGRAGMLYRDLVPDRQGGSIVASQVRIETAGPVADYVHHHRVRFQAIYCYKGWVRVVYEDQGPPFVLQPGDCVLQPPGIRHRVLESSAGLEVVEVASPAAHETLADHDLGLPTSEARPERSFAGQRFVRHQAASARWQASGLDGFESRNTGIAEATGGLASVQVLRAVGTPTSRWHRHDAEPRFLFLLAGRLTLRLDGRQSHPLTEGDALVIPSTQPCAFAECSAGTELLEVAWPASFRLNG